MDAHAALMWHGGQTAAAARDAGYDFIKIFNLPEPATWQALHWAKTFSPLAASPVSEA